MQIYLKNRVLSNPKLLFALYRKGQISPSLLSRWQRPSYYTPFPAAILGRVDSISVLQKKSSRKFRNPDPQHGEALLCLAEQVIKKSWTYVYWDHQKCLFALDLIARFSANWIRPVSEFFHEGDDLEPLLRALYRHLLVVFPIPLFFYNALFSWESENRILSQIRVGQGISVRNTLVHKTLPLSARGCHFFLQAPEKSSYDKAMSWAYYKSFGCSDEVVCALMNHAPQNTPFWNSVYSFLARQASVCPGQVRIILDYVHSIKFRRRQLANGQYMEPPSPQFEMKGRTVQSLLRAANQWHTELSRQNLISSQSWAPSFLKPYYAESENFDYGVIELLNSRELQIEGWSLHHCVSTYVETCAKRRSAIFSCQRWMAQTNLVLERLLTIQVNLRDNTIVQARGKFNAAPDGLGRELMMNFANKNRLAIESL